ncbi:MAG: hypothetical protein ACO293_00680 [Nitrosopumilaceae archaeon]
MNHGVIIFSIILSALILLPSAYAQIFEDSKQKSIEVKINSLGEIEVTHVVRGQGEPHQIVLLDGKKENLIVKDEEGNAIQYGSIEDEDSLMIFPSRDDVIIKYDLIDELIMEGNFWTMEFLYLQSTSFILPDDADLIFVNNKPVMLGDKKGIMCHGCQMILEYSLNEPKKSEKIKIQDKEYSFEIRTFSEIHQFGLNEKLDGLNLEVVGENEFVTIIIPVNFLAEPYEVLVDEEKIFFHDYINNGTHVWINLRPESSGDITITGTVIPDVSKVNSQDYSPFVYVGVSIIAGISIAVFLVKRKQNQV